MTKEKAFYQAKLIIDNLDEKEKMLIPQEFIDYIEANMEYDPSIVIDADIPFEQQKIDDKTYDILEEMLSKIDKKKIKEIEEQNQQDYYDLKNENMKLKQQYQNQKIDNEKIIKIKDLVQGYKTELNKKTQEVERLKKINDDLYKNIKSAPWIIRKLYFKKIDNLLLDQ